VVTVSCGLDFCAEHLEPRSPAGVYSSFNGNDGDKVGSQIIYYPGEIVVLDNTRGRYNEGSIMSRTI